MTAAPRFAHNQPERTGLLLINLGTPEAASAPALRRYLKEFLSDPRVVEIPRLLWWPILHGIILNTRPKKSAAKYASIWMPEGSPLRVYTEKLTRLLRGRLGEAGHDLEIAYAMRYGQPSIAGMLDTLRNKGCTRILVLPLYPQYAGSTSATAIDEVARHLFACRNQYELRTVRSFPGDAGYIRALAARIRHHWMQVGPLGDDDLLILSFHGVPRRTLDLGDPYHCECHKTARLLATELGLRPTQWQLTFQSRFGRAQWLEPYTAPTLAALGRAGTRRVDVACPGFVADCLETLEEIALEGKAEFLGAGGTTFHYIPCLNDDPAWVEALADLALTHLTGWPTAPQPEAAELAARLARARALGATG